MRPREIARRSPGESPPPLSQILYDKRHGDIYPGRRYCKVYVPAVRRNSPRINQTRSPASSSSPRGPPAPPPPLFRPPSPCLYRALSCRVARSLPPSGPGGGAKPGVHRRRPCSRPRLENDRDEADRRSPGVRRPFVMKGICARMPACGEICTTRFKFSYFAERAEETSTLILGCF